MLLSMFLYENMALEGLTDQFLDLTLGNAHYLPFCPPEDVKRTLRSLNDIPHYLFRVFTPESCGITDRSWAKSMDARHTTEDHDKDIFARAGKSQVAAMVNAHLRWYTSSSDNLVSWTSSLLFALVYIFYLRANTRDGSAFENISVCIVDTTCFPPGVFIQDLDLIRAYKSSNSELASFETLRSKKHRSLSGHFYFGEYLSQGALRIKENCEVVSSRALIDRGLYDLLPELKSFAHWKPQRTPQWANPVVELRCGSAKGQQ
ncbi:hypothetical protein CT0861_00672 [Colletotrichum tofieldiae]|uniref:DUF7587 domain-containing protein n=1 Tax=Colletotrichum tofieldiae TaxID=708197 RepID=A0A161W2I7_9PEZI|nr:hypothetical protein CT0861_00672 [Colletotrichum tofieldiae]